MKGISINCGFTQQKSPIPIYLRTLVKHALLCLTALLFVTSCDESDTIPQANGGTTTASPISTVRDPLPLSIDSADLIDLPVDTGGVHTAYPLYSTDAVYGHFVYTPSGYSEVGPEYPLLIYLHGWDVSDYTGTDEEELAELLLGTTPPSLIHSGRWRPSFPFIVASPRLKTPWYWNHNDIHSFIEYMINEYQVNTGRIYLTGLSLGGGGTWYYVGERGLDNYVAAIVPISARGEERIISNLIDTPIWAFHGDSDTSVPPYDNFGSARLVEEINAMDPLVPAKITLFNYTGHDAWSRVYSNQFSRAVAGDAFSISIYDWLLQYKKE